MPITNSSADFLSFYAAFCLFVRTLPIDFALLGRKRKYIKSKMTGKFIGKQTLIAAVRDQFLSFATFPTPLPSRYRLLLKGFLVVTERKYKIYHLFNWRKKCVSKLIFSNKAVKNFDNHQRIDKKRWFSFTRLQRISTSILLTRETIRYKKRFSYCQQLYY